MANSRAGLEIGTSQAVSEKEIREKEKRLVSAFIKLEQEVVE